ncbi:MAG TPA: OmcA/MtrC family decaheme c-type cytochrome, partial [Bryobacteraceae bacterium]|nr:OmcA/MtrC family decaheme c-type cytochrome [Bryobacteraceae bacterium]
AFSPHEKAYYASPSAINFVRPGLVTKILSADIAADGTIRARIRITDPQGLGLDRLGVDTPGVVSTSFIAAFIPQGQKQYVAYTTRVQTSPINSVAATQAGSDANGVYVKTADGEYTYTFGTKAPATIDRTATHSIGVYSSRNLTLFDMGTQYSDNVFNFVPDGSAVKVTRDVVRTAACNQCHNPLGLHGGSRRSVELCVMCHTAQTTDPDTGNTVNFPVMVHKIHMGSSLPSVQAGGKYQIIGNAQSLHDWSNVEFPADARNCQTCHDAKFGAAQANAYMTPNRAACGACHDNVNFATGQNHVSLPQVSDSQCSSCHTPQGELEFDASIMGAHTIPTKSKTLPGVVIQLLKVDNGSAGQKPEVTFTLKDNSGAPIPLTGMNRLALVMSGPTTDYGSTNFGVATPGYVSENALTSSTCSTDGTCVYQFVNAIPAGSRGTFTIGVEGRRTATLLAGTEKQMTTNYGAINKQINFSVDGSPVKARRTVVATAKCNSCHSFLSLHGENRNQVEQCVLCHNPNENDKSFRPAAEGAPQSVNFAQMIHKIHTGEEMTADGGSLIVFGFGGSKNDFSEVRFPGDRRDCNTCHVNGSEQLPLQAGLQQVSDMRGLINPIGPIASACTGCHVSSAAASHALANTTSLGESCAVCHGQTADFSVNKVHAR